MPGSFSLDKSANNPKARDILPLNFLAEAQDLSKGVPHNN